MDADSYNNGRDGTECLNTRAQLLHFSAHFAVTGIKREAEKNYHNQTNK